MRLITSVRVPKKASQAILALVLVLALLVVAAFFFSRAGVIPGVGGGAPASTTASDIAEFTVAGGSMEPALASGQIIRVDTSAYSRAPIRAGDIVLIEQPGGNEHLVKFIRAIPGDTLSLLEQPGGSQVLINNEVLKNSEGEPYLLPENKRAMIGLYIRDYAGVVPEGAYLVLGNHATGSTDSTVFGLVSVGRIKGRVLTE